MPNEDVISGKAAQGVVCGAAFDYIILCCAVDRACCVVIDQVQPLCQVDGRHVIEGDIFDKASHVNAGCGRIGTINFQRVCGGIRFALNPQITTTICPVVEVVRGDTVCKPDCICAC